MNSFWSGWIVALTVLNIIGALWLLYATSRRKPGDEKPGAETTGHSWDGDLREFNNPLPRWWLWLFYGTVVFAVGYVIVFPGLGAFQGTAGWSQVSQWQAQTDAAKRNYEQRYARFDTMTVADLQKDADAMRIAKNLFGNNCAMCHGSDGRGAKGYPNLHQVNYKWGRETDAVLATIGAGRIGVMPAWKDTIGAAGVEEVANYVYQLSGRKADAAKATAGAEKFATFCAACHGPDAKGMTALGAPNLTDSYWIYGGSLETIKETVANGRQNQMPAWADTLGEQKVKLLAAYVLAFAGADAPAPTAAQTAQNDAPVATPPADAAADHAPGS
jgi:cytochrome c oxidase cbb3-type subunit 3